MFGETNREIKQLLREHRVQKNIFTFDQHWERTSSLGLAQYRINLSITVEQISNLNGCREDFRTLCYYFHNVVIFSGYLFSHQLGCSRDGGEDHWSFQNDHKKLECREQQLCQIFYSHFHKLAYPNQRKGGAEIELGFPFGTNCMDSRCSGITSSQWSPIGKI